jgi:hypothetical protein
VSQSKSSENLKKITNKRYPDSFDKKHLNLKAEETKDSTSLEAYDSFLRRYNIEPGQAERTTQQDSGHLHHPSGYSNFIEQKKMENNLSFSNNNVEPSDEDSGSEHNITTLEELDLDYEAYAQREHDRDSLSEQGKYSSFN